MSNIPCTLDPLGSHEQNYIEPNTVVYFAEGGSVTSFEMQKGVYFIEAVGGGGGASYSVAGSGMGSGGGSGGCIRGYYNIPKGRYSLYSGRKGDDSNMTNIPKYERSPSGEKSGVDLENGVSICIAYGGEGAKRASPYGVGGGTYSNPSFQTGDIVSNITGANGANGGLWSIGKGGASIYGGYGKGGDGNAPLSGTNGFLKITYIRRT